MGMRNVGTKLWENQYILDHNIKATLDKRSDNYKEVKPFLEGAVVTTGPNSGVAQTPFFHTQFLIPGHVLFSCRADTWYKASIGHEIPCKFL